MGILKRSDRAAVVAGLRTPFAKRGTALSSLSALDLGKLCVAELLGRVDLPESEIDEVVFGQVMPGSPQSTNIARDIVVGTGMPRDTEAYSVARACATSYQATVNVVQAIADGAIDCGVAGGADSASDVPFRISKSLGQALEQAAAAETLSDRLGAFAHLKPRDLAPVPPELREPSSELTMGDAAEKMAKENGISREAQDEFAHRSHRLASIAWEEGRFDDEVMPVHVPPAYERTIRRDNLVRSDSNLDAYARLEPAFDREHGTVTAGNSSPLTDGAAALLLMRQEKADALGLDVLGFVRSYAFTAVDPNRQMLMGPVYATPIALERAKIELSDIDLFDMHEAFSSQMLSVLQAFESDDFAREHLGRSERLGEIDRDKLNVNGGSIALGHPFAATGARQIHQTLRELRRRGKELALCTACAAGGLGAAIVLEAA